jgi:xylulokinase
MGKMALFLGIDIGTSAVKALLISETGEVISSASVEYPLLTPKTGWAEQEPESWWNGTVLAVRKCLEKARSAQKCAPDVAAVGLTGQMHGSIFLDRRGSVLRNAILWCDQRTEEQCREITEITGFDTLIKTTFNKALAGFTAPKILWLRRHEPEVYAGVEKVLLPKDYIRFRLTGAFATEVSDASGTLLFNVAERRWSDDMLRALEIPRAWMPDCYESPVISSRLNREGAAALGLPEGTPVAGGGGDQAAGAVGNGIVSTGLASCVLGTSGVIFWHADKPVFDPRGRLHSFCHAVPGKWHLMGVTLSAGGSLRWLRDNFCAEEIEEARLQNRDPYEIMVEKAEKIPAGSEGLIFLPYLAGERTPYADASARGAFIGLSLRHNRAHLMRSVMEGVTMSLKDCLELGLQTGVNAEKIYLSGGGARSSLWRRMAADIFGAEISRVTVDEGPAYGAAILSAVGVGAFPSVEEACLTLVKTADSIKPEPESVPLYRALYELYGPLYAALKEHYHHNSAFLDKY